LDTRPDAPIEPRPPRQHAREAQAHAEVGQTTISPRVARALTGAFLLLACAVPLFELSRVFLGDTEAGAPWRRLGQIPADVRAAGVRSTGAWDRTVSANRAVLAGLHAFDDALEDESRLGSRLRPRTQAFLTSALAAGNERAYIGHDGWLFYRPDVDYVTAPGFLAEEYLARRIHSADEWADPVQPDPRPAILQFRDSLRASGIVLIVMPTPVKPTVHPERLAAGYAGAPAPANPDQPRLVEELRAANVHVFDPAETLYGQGRLGATQYLATDTHWRPDAMEQVAALLAEEIQRIGNLSAVADPGYQARAADVRGRGDIFFMLDLPASQPLFDEETVTVRRIAAADGTPWRPSTAGDVLVLGDSFSNIYSLESMGWGASAGLVEQLSFALRRPVDRIVQNDAGAYATRELLHRSGPERLVGKKIVVWQFATRELASGDWRLFGR
jgi:alginate O-acetyltransferase complex protein AlgJ